MKCYWINTATVFWRLNHKVCSKISRLGEIFLLMLMGMGNRNLWNKKTSSASTPVSFTRVVFQELQPFGIDDIIDDSGLTKFGVNLETVPINSSPTRNFPSIVSASPLYCELSTCIIAALYYLRWHLLYWWFWIGGQPEVNLATVTANLYPPKPSSTAQLHKYILQIHLTNTSHKYISLLICILPNHP